MGTSGDRARLPGWLGRSRRAAVLALLATNAVPLLGVVIFGWSVQTLLVLYWLESGVVGAFNVPKVRRAHGAETAASRKRALRLKSNGSTVSLPEAPATVPDEPVPRPETRRVARFFLGHYGGFWLVHGAFVFLVPLFAGGAGRLGVADLPTLVFATLAAVVSHGVSYRENYLAAGAWRRVSPGERLYAPYGRVLVMHLTIVVGAFVVSAAGTSVAALVVMVLVKTALDLRAHLREHEREGRRSSEGERPVAQ
ncbi:DUF6498-containing protein [Salinirubellus salinus]|uniref:DUF6498-containing protein n=1 Tax=Salinirubellus salinus TaxID=1364945 RepID=A0A9E7R8E0_9EURY|nr:DUF6498-containing protein [Salinirubellus salinus]UWM56515.1 DUF6498-containing protein [Salinirubellus salinus]